MNENCEKQELPEMQTEAVATETVAENPEGSTTEAEEINEETNVPETDAGEAAITEAEIEARIAEAEHRGYLRGLNEQAERLLKRPAVGETCSENKAVYSPEEEVMILNNIRKSIWDV